MIINDIRFFDCGACGHPIPGIRAEYEAGVVLPCPVDGCDGGADLAHASRHAGPWCDHSESLYGRCVACGMTWDQQAEGVEW